MRAPQMSTALITLAAAAAVLTGCGGSDSPATSSGAGGGSAAAESAPAASPLFNDADVAFVQGMIPHHEQAVEMAELAPGRTTNEEVLTLATEIAQGQQPEIGELTGLLQAWGVAASTAPAESSDGDMGGMDHGGMDHGGGMMSEADLGLLETLSGAQFDRQWLSTMIAHHTGAVGMAETEQADGENPEALELAGEIARTQQAEIDRMAALLPQG